MSARKLPGRGMGERDSSFARSFFSSAEGGDGEEVELDESVPVPRSRPLGRLASRRNLIAAKRPSVRNVPSQRGVEASKSGDSNLSSAAASISSATAATARGSLTNSIAVPAAPPRNAEENYLRQSMLRGSIAHSVGSGGDAAGFDMNAIQAALKEDDALEAGFDDEEVLEQYKIMAQHEAALRVKANTGFDMEDYEKRRKATGNETKDKKEMFGGGRKPHLGLPPPQPISSSSFIGGMSSPPPLPLKISVTVSENYRKFMDEQKKKEEELAELSLGKYAKSTTQAEEEDHIVRCWGCRNNLSVNYIATLIQCPECGTVSQARKKA